MEAILEQLHRFRLTTEKMDSPLSIEVKSLLDEQQLEKYLESLGHHIETTDRKVAASIFVKRYAFLAVIYLYAMTSWDEKLNIAYENLSIETDEQNKLWLPGFHFHDFQFESRQNDRKEWRKKCIEDLFKNHITPILDLLSQTTRVSKLILFENIAVYIFWLYEKVFMEEGTPADIVDRSKEDFQYILYEAEGSLFGNDDVNPLVRYYQKVDPNEVRKRSTCCYSYLTDKNEYCSTCPRKFKKKSVT